MPDDILSLIEAELHSGAREAALGRLAHALHSAKRYDDLFDVRLMQGRLAAGLSPTESKPLEELPEALRAALQQHYIAACREVGGLWLNAGRLRQAWLYLRPAGDRAAMRQHLEALSIDADDVDRDEAIEIALQEGVQPLLGFCWLLAQSGICDAITVFESHLRQFPIVDQQAAAGLLVRALHDELRANLRAEIQQREGAAPPDTTIRALVETRDWLFAERNYHIDTTHLAAIVRFARMCDDRETLRLAIDLTEYGRRLDPQLRGAGDEPFRDTYLDSALFLQALLGDHVERAIALFRQRAEQLAATEHGPIAAETYISLLSRANRHAQALSESERLLRDAPRVGVAPAQLELSRRAGDFRGYLKSCRQHDDWVGFATGVLAELEAKTPRDDSAK